MSRFRTLLSTGVLAVGVALPLMPSAVSADPLPQTGYELSGGARWTTLEEEYDFLGKVDQASRRVTIDQAGSTVQGRPMHLVRIGEPAPAANKTVVLFLCSQHGPHQDP